MIIGFIIVFALLTVFIAVNINFNISGVSESQTIVEITVSSAVSDMNGADTFPINRSTDFSLQCTQCTVLFQVSSHVTLHLNLIGNSNAITIRGGLTYLSGSGNFDSFNLSDTTVVSNSMTGNNDSYA
jgi:hypothetical protein